MTWDIWISKEEHPECLTDKVVEEYENSVKEKARTKGWSGKKKSHLTAPPLADGSSTERTIARTPSPSTPSSSSNNSNTNTNSKSAAGVKSMDLTE